jgi:hypothetical protein
MQMIVVNISRRIDMADNVVEGEGTVEIPPSYRIKYLLVGSNIEFFDEFCIVLNVFESPFRLSTH